MSDDPEQRVLAAWRVNALPWTTAVRGHRIESRRLVTDAAIVRMLLECKPVRLLDIGCGEGWLAREVAGHGVEVMGVDAVPELIAQATAAGGGEFHVLGYDAIAAGALAGRDFDVAVANFSLLGGDSAAAVLRALPAVLAPSGRLVVQTLHPAFATTGMRYEDGWRDGSWAGIDGDFDTPAPWFFRTLGSWLALLSSSGLELLALREPLHPASGLPVSLLMLARCHAA